MIQPIQIHNEQIYAHQLEPVVADASYRVNGAPMPQTRRNIDVSGPDYYPTPKWCTHALMQMEQFNGQIWEPACGDGKMVEVLRKYSTLPIVASDLYDRNYGAQHDFLRTTNDYRIDNVITNPPFNCAQLFLDKALTIATSKVALLLRLAFLETTTRYNNIFAANAPSRVWVFSERPTFYPANDDRETGGSTAYAWFVWNKSVLPYTQIGAFIEEKKQTELKWIPPGFKAKYGC